MRRFALLVFIIASPCRFLALNADDGSLDPSFGGNDTGYLIVQHVASTFTCYAVAIQTDGKIVVAGANNQIVRLNPNGSPDNTFGTAGTAVVATTLFSIRALVIQPDGSIVACGFDSSNNGLLTRCTSAGIIDNSFGTSGNGVATAPALANCPLYSMVQQADGKIVVGAQNIYTGIYVVMRFNANGSPDITFAVSPSPVIFEGSSIAGLVVQADGKIVALTGAAKTQDFLNPIYLVRYRTDGSIDEMFGENGLATGPIGANTGLVIQPDGKLLVGGNGTGTNLQVTRFDTQGNLDTSFNGTGFNNTVLGLYCNAMLLQADGAIVLVGESLTENLQLTRYTSTGIVDSSFVNDSFLSGIEPYATALQADGDIIVGGNFAQFAEAYMARYLSSPIVTPTQINAPSANIVHTINSPIAFAGAAQDPSLVFLLIDGVLQPQGTHTDPNNWSITATAKTVGTHTAQAVSVYQDGNLNIASDPITFIISPQAPSNFTTSFTGTITKNEFLNKTECVLQATWTPSSDRATTHYIIAQNGVILATIPATQPLQFVYCGSCKGNAFNGITVSAATA
ncbi:MAG: delta-60 repeat domain-containing protein, partial [Candidatus Babeliales bacterium]